MPSGWSARGLSWLLEALAQQTWDKIRFGPSCGLPFGEEGITEHNLFDLYRSGASVRLRTFTHQEERLNGADFDWYIGNAGGGWIGLRFQAKKLRDGYYDHLGHHYRPRNGPPVYQFDNLLNSARLDRMWPLYCFYNGWAGGWPAAVRPWTPTSTAPCCPAACWFGHSMQSLGCAVAPAGAVAFTYRNLSGPARLALAAYLPHSRPWACLIRCPPRCCPLDPGDGLQPGPTAGIDPHRIADGLRIWTNQDRGDGADLPPPEGLGIHETLPEWLTQDDSEPPPEVLLPRMALVISTPTS